MTDQTPDLARRVSAHDRILQVLISELGERDGPLLERMAKALASQGGAGSAEAERFVREARQATPARPVEPVRTRAAPAPAARMSGLIPIGVRKRNGIWEVRTELGHHGDYRQRSDAIEAALNEVGTRIDAGGVVDFQVEGRAFAIARHAAALAA